MLSIIAIILAYLLGSVSGSLLLGRLRDVDIRQQGSGNAGGTNAFRTQGFIFALGVVIIDIGKGAIATLIPDLLQISQPDNMLAAACGFAAIIGHCYPIWYKFSGGKGAGTFIGVLLVLAPVYMLPVLAVWVLVIVLSGYVGLATILAVCTLIPVVLLDKNSGTALVSLTIAATSLIIFTHRENISRLFNGTENRFEKARIQNWF
ncbi:MAG: glycerol-3-phosphate 1-O-acyltransferase PlsY, partial [Proteobacteria bacterium]|nr:glycerol-3-phosphate 1-O-acyltransferase PlsY [Pseudomonadota bacterium]